MQLRARKTLFLKLMRLVLKHVPLERWIQYMIGGLKTVNLTWVNKIGVVGCTWGFVYERAFTYEGRKNAVPVHSYLNYDTYFINSSEMIELKCNLTLMQSYL